MDYEEYCAFVEEEEELADEEQDLEERAEKLKELQMSEAKKVVTQVIKKFNPRRALDDLINDDQFTFEKKANYQELMDEIYWRELEKETLCS